MKNPGRLLKQAVKKKILVLTAGLFTIGMSGVFLGNGAVSLVEQKNEAMQFIRELDKRNDFLLGDVMETRKMVKERELQIGNLKKESNIFLSDRDKLAEEKHALAQGLKKKDQRIAMLGRQISLLKKERKSAAGYFNRICRERSFYKNGYNKIKTKAVEKIKAVEEKNTADFRESYRQDVSFLGTIAIHPSLMKGR